MQGDQMADGAMKAKSFRDLIVWQKAMTLTVTIYRLTRDFPREEQYGLISQMRRTAVSVPSNIAEGQGRLRVGDFRHFLGIARGANFELQTQLEVARALDMGEGKLIDEAGALSQEISKMLYAMLVGLKTDSRIARN